MAEQGIEQAIIERAEIDEDGNNLQSNEAVVAQNDEGSVGGEVDEPPAKKTKVSSTSGETEPKDGKNDKDLYPYAKLRGIRIFSEREINAQDAEMTREYWNFWNKTAEELCSDRAYNDWGKRDLKLFIDAAWVAHKTQLHEVHEREIQESVKELQERYGDGELPSKLKTEDENVTELLAQVS